MSETIVYNCVTIELAKDVDEDILRDTELMDRLEGAIICGPDGHKLTLGKPELISPRAIRMPVDATEL